MITILLQKILAALTQLLGDIKTKLNTIKDNLDNLIVVATASGPIASFTTTLTRSLLSCIVDIPESVSGTDTVIITQTGKNLFSKPAYSSWTSAGSYNKLSNIAPNNTELIMSFTDKDTTVDVSGCYFGFVEGSYNTGLLTDYRWCLNNGNLQSNKTNKSINSATLCNSLLMYPNNETTYNKITSRWDIQIEVGSTATTYEAYTATTKTVSPPQTVYGGAVDVISGNITKTYNAEDLGNLTWYLDEDYFYSDSITNIISSSDKCLCESGYTYNTSLSEDKTFTVIGTQIRFRDDSYSSTPDFKTAVTGINFIYELYEVETDSITPEVITAINGVNNIFSDSGNVTVEYLKLYKEA